MRGKDKEITEKDGGTPLPTGVCGYAAACGPGDVDKNAIQRIECRQRFVTDIELKVIAKVLGVTCDELLTDSGPF